MNYINVSNYKNHYSTPSFGKAKLRIPLSEACASEGVGFAEKFHSVEEYIQNYRFWHLIVDEDGYKLAYKNTSKEYSILDKPRRHAKDTSLLIRTINNAHKIKGKITSFKIELGSMEEVRDMYKKITKATWLERVYIIIKALEAQAQKQYCKQSLKKPKT